MSRNERSEEELAEGLAGDALAPRKKAVAAEVLRRPHGQGWTVELWLRLLTAVARVKKLIVRKTPTPQKPSDAD
jgi:hypothetical protein